uniref:hypothetical protein n=1 Tax=Rhodococcus erythropolis TaxID=1833 RepID=UPI00117B7810|nr:hypothetical protein [Rhodococcus erythropolis]
MDSPDSAHTCGDEEAISVAKAAVLLSGGSFDADTEAGCRRVLSGESQVAHELSAFRPRLRG